MNIISYDKISFDFDRKVTFMAKVSFDFDGTLEFKEVQDVARDLIKEGHTVCILTTRFSDPSKYTFDVTKAHQHLFDVAKDIGITEIHFTEFEWKYKSIDNYNIDIHIDDCYREEVYLINSKCKARAILYPTEWWRKELYGLLKNY